MPRHADELTEHYRAHRAEVTGGAHGARWTESLNLLTRSVTDVGIEDLFSEPARGVKALSDYAISHLLNADEGRQRDERWVREGAGADSKNFRSFNFTRSSLLLTFDEYQVGSYAEGASEVDVPLDVVRPIFTPTIEQAVSELG